MDPNDLLRRILKKIDVVSFWSDLGKLTNTSEERRFPTVALLAKSVLSFPHSNVDVERIFSQVALIKTKW